MEMRHFQIQWQAAALEAAHQHDLLLLELISLAWFFSFAFYAHPSFPKIQLLFQGMHCSFTTTRCQNGKNFLRNRTQNEKFKKAKASQQARQCLVQKKHGSQLAN
jgi:hypothetical protein